MNIHLYEILINVTIWSVNRDYSKVKVNVVILLTKIFNNKCTFVRINVFIIYVYVRFYCSIKKMEHCDQKVKI